MAICGCGKEMLTFGATITTKAPYDYSYGYGGRSFSMICQQQLQCHHNRPSITISSANIKRIKSARSFLPMKMLTAVAISVVSLAVILVLVVVEAGNADALESEDTGTLSNIPRALSSDCIFGDCKKARIQRPKSRKAEICTVKCVTTCVRGGLGAPGEGPLNIRGPLVVFKQGFRSRQYCLAECSDICNLIGDGDDGP